MFSGVRWPQSMGSSSALCREVILCYLCKYRYNNVERYVKLLSIYRNISKNMNICIEVSPFG